MTRTDFKEPHSVYLARIHISETWEFGQYCLLCSIELYPFKNMIPYQTLFYQNQLARRKEMPAKFRRVGKVQL